MLVIPVVWSTFARDGCSAACGLGGLALVEWAKVGTFVLLGHSWGASLMAAYQAAAVTAPLFRLPATWHRRTRH